MKPNIPSPPDLNRWMPHRMAFAAVVLLGAFGAIGWRLHQIQVKEHKLWASRGEGMVKQKIVLPAMRGAIRDSNGELLAHDKQMHDVWINLQHLRDFNDVRMRLAKLQNTSITAISARMSDEAILAEYRSHVVAVLQSGLKSIDADPLFPPLPVDTAFAEAKKVEFPWLIGLGDMAAEAWEKLLKENGVGAVTVRSRVRRFYPCAERLTHVIGYVNDKAVDPETGRMLTKEEASKQRVRTVQIGYEGVEAVMNDALTGTDGYRWIERDRRGRELTEFRGETVPARHGDEVWLTIDMHLQDTMEEVLEEAYAFHQPQHITAVMVDPKTGAVLAMASRPHIERDRKSHVTANLAISGRYEPGSVFKIITYATALENRLTSPDDMLNCDPGQRMFGGLDVSDHYSGPLKMSDAFAWSSNRAAYVLAHRIGEKRFIASVDRFGFGKPTGIALLGEASGMVHRPGSKWWDGLTFSRMSYGHAVQVTPLQMCMAVAAIANGGMLMKPQIIKEVRDARNEVVRTFAQESAGRVCSQRTADLMRQIMVGVVENPKGTGAQARIQNVTVAGKTGTSQLYTPDGKAIWTGHHCVSFAGFAPAEDPSLCAIIVVHDPSTSNEDATGGRLAAPIFSRLMQRCLQTIAVVQTGAPSVDSPLKSGAQ